MLMHKMVGSAFALMAVMSVSTTLAAETDSFTHVTISVAGKTHIHHGAEYRVVVNASEEEKKRIQVDIDGESLRIHCSSSCNSLRHDGIDIYMPTIKRLSLHNGGKITVGEGFPAVPTLSLVIHNGGSIQASSLTGEQVGAEIYNGGQIGLAACNTLDAKIRNGGSILYRGIPKVNKDVINGGSVNKNKDSELLKACAAEASTS